MKFPLHGALALTALALFTACDDKSAIEPEQQASVRFVNATGDVTGLNFSVNGTAATAAQNLAFGAATQCTSVTAGQNAFSASVVGGGAFGSALNQSLAPNARYTIVATGTAASPQYLVLSDAAAAPTPGNARLRIVNAVPGTTASDIFVTTPDAELGTPTASNIAYNAGTSFLSVPAGETRIRFADTGTTTVTYTGDPFTVQAGTTQTIVVAPGQTPGTFRTINITPCT